MERGENSPKTGGSRTKDDVDFKKNAVKISYKTVKDYFPKGRTPQEYEKVIKQALEEWF